MRLVHSLPVLLLAVAWFVAPSCDRAPEKGTEAGELPEPSLNQRFLELATAALQHLDETEFVGEGFDYWPNGGLQSVYAHLRTFLSYEELVALSPVPIYLSGPHSDTALSLDERFEFGRYNPEFIGWLDRHARAILDNEPLISSTRSLFAAYLQRTALTYWDTRRVLQKHPDERNRLLEAYGEGLENRTLEEDHYYGIAWDGEENYRSLAELYARWDVNVVAPAVYFWLRREMDGTAPAIHDLLTRVLRSFCPQELDTLE